MNCTGRQALAIGTAATFVHLAIFLTACGLYHLSVEAYSDKGDGASYKHVAAAILGNHASLDEYDSRVFPGYPLLIAVVREFTGLSLGASALFITFISAGVAAGLAASFFKDFRIGMAVAFLLPHAWINMSLAMSEAPMLACEMLALMLARRNAVACGIAFALAILTRPIAAIALIALLFERTAADRFREGLLTAATAATIFLAAMLLLTPITGGLFHPLHVYANSPRAYAGRLFTWPFHSILWMTFHGHVGVLRWVYVMTHVALCLGGCAILLRKNSPVDLLAFVWLSLNTLFVLCLGLGPGAWGFNHFPRFTIPALPALAWSWRTFLPRTLWLYIPLGVGLFAMAVFAVLSTP